jgi:hypothetical protein
MRIANHCQDRALLLLQAAEVQAAEECPQFKEQAEFLTHEWLVIAAIQIDLARIRQAEKEVRTN